MRFGFALFIGTLLCQISLSQVVPDTTQINIGDKTIIVIDANPEEKTLPSDAPAAVSSTEGTDLKHELTHFAGIDFGFCQLADIDGNISRDSSTSWLSINSNRSLTWRLNLLEQKFRIHRDYVGFYTGFAIAYNSYGLSENGDVVVNDDTGTTLVSIDPDIRNYTKNKLRTTSLQVPLMLEINSSENIRKSVSLAFGAIGGWVTSVITKQKWEDENGRFTQRRKDDFKVNPFTIDFSARIGYRKTSLFFTYSLTPLFSKNQGYRVYPITFGVQLIQF